MPFSNYSITLALLSFFSTTVDDFCVILIFFAREYVKTHSLSNPDTVLAFVKISIGQLIGFTIIANYADAQWTPNGIDIFNSNTGTVGLGPSAPASLLNVYDNSQTGGELMLIPILIMN